MATKIPSEMPFLDHLEELRMRIIWSLGALLVGIGISAFLVLRYNVLGYLEAPIIPYLPRGALVFTTIGGPLRILLTTAFAGGITLALPVILYQIWSFLSPGLYGHEKRVAIPALFAATCLFIGGALLGYKYILPMTLRWLLELPVGPMEPMITVETYFSFMISMCLALGAVFELPIVIVGFTAIGLVTPQMLNKFRRYAIVGSYAAAAVITPGDIFVSTLVLFVVLYVLFEVSVVGSYVVYRRKMRAREAARVELAEHSA